MSTPAPVWSVWTDKWGLDGVMTTEAFPNIKPAAKPIFVAYEAKDQELLASATSNASISAVPESSGNTLSGGTIAGIVVGSAAGGILAAVLFFAALWCCMGFRLTRNRVGGLGKSESHHELAAKEAAMTPQADSRAKEGSPHWSATELPSSGQPHSPTIELDTSATHGRTELPGYREYKP